ncbi:hypothetical protein Aduo_009151 [Ancylostoma duodenale]
MNRRKADDRRANRERKRMARRTETQQQRDVRDIFVLLFDFMRRDDVFAQSYRMMEEVVREEEERAREENRQHIPIKMVFEKRSSDRDLATSNEVAAV